MLTLFVENTGHSESVVPVRWCVSKDLLDQLKDYEVSKPHLLLSVLQKKEDGYHREVARKLVPLDQGLEYIEFGTSGEHVLNAIIVWSRYDTFWMKDRILARSGRRYRDGAYSDSGSFETWWLNGLSEQKHKKNQSVSYLENSMAEISIVVGKEFFAKEPSALESWWVNLWYREAPFDQCEFRKRRIPAYSIQPPLVLVWMIFSVLNRLVYTLFALFLGMRDIRWSPIIHPFMESKDDILTNGIKGGSSIFMDDGHGGDKPWYIQLLFPPVVVILADIAWVINHFHVWDWAIFALAIFGTGIVLGGVLSKLLDLLVPNIKKEWNKLGERVIQYEKERAGEEKKRADTERRFALLYEDDMKFITCTGVPLQASVAALPKERQTVHLRFQELKAKRCRPFAQN